jgi:tetratricopeptide (TPR) repeat protein
MAATYADLARLAGEEACANAGAGLDLARHLGRHEVVDELAGAYAESCELAGRVEDAFSAWAAAADTATDPRTRARRLTRGGLVAWDLGRFADANQLLDAADRALSGVAVCAERIDVEEMRVRFAARSHDLAGLDESIARLAALGRATGSSRTRAATVYAQLVKAVHTGRYLDGLHLVNELTALARNEESVLVGEDLLRSLMAIQLCWGDLVAARASAEEGIRLARQSGVPALQIYHDMLLTSVEVLAGDWQAALRRTFNALDLAHRVGFTRAAAYALGSQALVFVRRGRLDEAADRVSQARRLFGKWSTADRHVFGQVDLVEGMIALRGTRWTRRSRLRTRPPITPQSRRLPLHCLERHRRQRVTWKRRNAQRRGWPVSAQVHRTPLPWRPGCPAWLPEPDAIRLALWARSTSSTSPWPASRNSACHTRRRSLDWTPPSFAAPPAIPPALSRRISTAHSRCWTGWRPSRRRTVHVPRCASWVGGLRPRPPTTKSAG